MKVVACTFERHASQVLEILNDAIVTSTALFDYEPRPAASMVAWFGSRQAGGYPVIGVEGEHGELLGFASLGSFRAWPAYKYTAEHSIYVHRDHRGKGLGRVLLQAVVDAARARDVHVLVGGIEATNTASIALHEALGFTHAGTIVHAGFKFGRWLDLCFYQRVLDTPEAPVDG